MRKSRVQALLTENELQVLKNLGLGYCGGIALAIQWMSHFYNCGLRPSMDLQHIGLAIMENPEISIELKQWLDSQRESTD